MPGRLSNSSTVLRAPWWRSTSRLMKVSTPPVIAKSAIDRSGVLVGEGERLYGWEGGDEALKIRAQWRPAFAGA